MKSILFFILLSYPGDRRFHFEMLIRPTCDWPLDKPVAVPTQTGFSTESRTIMSRSNCSFLSMTNHTKVAWSSWLWHLAHTEKVPGSIPGGTIFGRFASLSSSFFSSR
ncbi:Uncharacterized protein HZ326_17003 [Fusarium oxysporum f. sp. albedinis]|nr:Uncharacterized protein HZ326_17003 [Fusarium oxysporum f. sp. albedinis]